MDEESEKLSEFSSFDNFFQLKFLFVYTPPKA